MTAVLVSGLAFTAVLASWQVVGGALAHVEVSSAIAIAIAMGWTPI